MKIIYLILFAFNILYAEWDTITLKEHIERSDLIILAKFKEEVEKKEQKFGGIKQLVSFDINEKIRGKVVTTSIFVRGQSMFVCAPQMLFPNTPQTEYLLFLKQEGDTSTYYLVHGERSALVIDENKTVGWIYDEQKIDLGEVVTTSIEEVKKILYEEQTLLRELNDISGI